MAAKLPVPVETVEQLVEFVEEQIGVFVNLQTEAERSVFGEIGDCVDVLQEVGLAQGGLRGIVLLVKFFLKESSLLKGKY